MDKREIKAKRGINLTVLDTFREIVQELEKELSKRKAEVAERVGRLKAHEEMARDEETRYLIMLGREFLEEGLARLSEDVAVCKLVLNTFEELDHRVKDLENRVFIHHTEHLRKLPERLENIEKTIKEWSEIMNYLRAWVEEKRREDEGAV